MLNIICDYILVHISLLEAYRSDRQTARRRGMLNVRFRPVMHLRGEDDWVGTEARFEIFCRIRQSTRFNTYPSRCKASNATVG
ncbi:unnamed protein product [Heligmosomoides polygyrus]|uniref:Uncharacterized protein n=1 Tax=Heligmosomoides polygyrus TaxID=6339 RepID=A0A3P8FU59_HELPZ|nr:unnamed protein product [Heligmosomoides polygyrus]